MSVLEPEELELLTNGFVAVMEAGVDPETTSASMFELGWAEVLEASPVQAIAAAFGALGATGSAAGLIDDVLAHALGLQPDAGSCVLLPPPGRSIPPGRRQGGVIHVDGTASARLRNAETVIVAVESGKGIEIVSTSAAALGPEPAEALDPAPAVRRVRLQLEAADAGSIDGRVDLSEDGPAVDLREGLSRWSSAVSAARVALAHQLLGGARAMLGQARSHAIDRVQFGHSIAGFQAVRHKLAESLVHIEGAEAVVAEWEPGCDPLISTVAKSLAGRSALAVAAHSQQVLAGIGFTTEHPFHRWMKRTLVLDVLFGSANTLPAEIGSELLARGAAPRLVEL